ncbi:hypothetical protein BEWA_050250 [Theileria equi strain WA]|uniref:Signal peptide-containing protein n=1 Tax=Theileria equi strain WA TaxID=1537102 RepID=L1LAR4_THEEQ|nr:hypothetical protein BEWA_050250 [Theileria equi strain WA]EKX72557.1 hypothetical protein BEWA_050250 [Theileria equi strain WA]|eukprot:XP_004832009.1 hypothetical protein BEWA_050250 [Theileria equi strain WA]
MTILSSTSLYTLSISFLIYSSIKTTACSSECHYALSFKDPVTLDISGETPGTIMEVEGEEYNGNRIFCTRPEFAEEYRIGDVMDGRELIFGDRLRNDEREVFTYVQEDGTTYVEVLSIYKGENGVIREIDEFLRRFNDSRYRRLIREPVELDVTNYDPSSGKIKMEVYSRGRRIYSVRDTLKYLVGVVRYGKRVIDDVTEGVKFKEVLVDERRGLTIEVARFMKNGDLVNLEYKFVGENEGFELVSEECNLAYEEV